MRRIDSIKPFAKNPRINDHAVAAVAVSSQEFGFRQPQVVDDRVSYRGFRHLFPPHGGGRRLCQATGFGECTNPESLRDVLWIDEGPDESLSWC
jgi:hypothetical protein